MERTENEKSLIDYIDSIFIADGEMIADNGEDGYMFSVNDNYGIIGVFDGCGGLGSRKYAEYNNKSGAYISSRAAAKAALTWFEKFSADKSKGLSQNTIKDICLELKVDIVNALKAYEQRTRSNTIKGSMTKSFPTTAAMILFENKNDMLYSFYIWAGDSRGFVLTPSGLTQITKDDIENEGDALDNISDDGKLTNVVSADGDFILNNRMITCEKKGVLITATDGCFGYFSTPMEFEYMLTDTLLKSNSIESWKKRISDYIKEYTADDYTVGLVAFGYKNFKKLKKEYSERHKLLYKKYIKRLDNTDKNEKLHLWNEYKDNYYRGV